MFKNSFLKIGFILILMGIFVMSLECVLAYINDYSIDIEKSNNIKNNINYYYKIFNLNTNELKDDMVIINDSFNVYFDDFDIGKNNILSSIEKMHDKLNDNSFKIIVLYNSCQYDIDNNLLNEKCRVFSNNYLKMIESYRIIINKYNDFVKQYNSYAYENSKNKLNFYSDDINLLLKLIYNDLK